MHIIQNSIKKKKLHLLKNFEDFADTFANRQKVTHLFHLVTTHQEYLKKQFCSIHTVPYHKFIAQKDYQHNGCVFLTINIDVLAVWEI